MKEQVGLGDGVVVLLSIGTYTGSLLTSYLWGWTADRYGSKPVMQFSLGLMVILPLAWFLMPRNSPASAPAAMVIAVVAGAATLGWQISWLRYLYVKATPRERKSSYMAVHSAWFGLASGLGPLLAGLILKLTGDVGAELAVFTIDPYTPLFALSFVLLVAGSLASGLRTRLLLVLFTSSTSTPSGSTTACFSFDARSAVNSLQCSAPSQRWRNS